MSKSKVAAFKGFDFNLYENFSEISGYAAIKAGVFMDMAQAHQSDTDKIRNALDHTLLDVIKALQKESGQAIYNAVGYDYASARGLFRSSRFILESKIAQTHTKLGLGKVFNTICRSFTSSDEQVEALISFIDDFTRDHCLLEEQYHTHLSECLATAYKTKDLTIARHVLGKLQPSLFSRASSSEFAITFVPLLEKANGNNFRKDVLRFLKSEVGVNIPQVLVMSKTLKLEIEEVGLEELSANASATMQLNNSRTTNSAMRRI